MRFYNDIKFLFFSASVEQQYNNTMRFYNDIKFLFISASVEQQCNTTMRFYNDFLAISVSLEQHYNVIDFLMLLNILKLLTIHYK